MSSTLRAHLTALCSRAVRTTPEENLDPAIDALGYALWLGAIGAKDEISKSTATDLEHIGHRALEAIDTAPPHARQAEDDDDDRAAVNATLKAIMHGALWSLPGRSKSRAVATHLWQRMAPQAHPSPVTLVRLLAGKADGLTAGRYGLHVATCVSCKREVSILRTSREANAVSVVADRAAIFRAAEPLQLAAAEVARVRAPSEGTVIARRDNPALEAVLFADADARRLAIYAAKPEALRVVAKGATTEEALPGYWVGKLADSVRVLEARVGVGGQTVAWEVRLAPATEKKKASVGVKRKPSARNR